MPDYTVLLVANSWLCRLDGKILIRSCCLLYTAVKDYEVVNILQQSLRLKKPQHTAVQLIRIPLGGKMRLCARLTTRLFPTKPELLGRFDYSIVQALCVVTRKEELYCREESGNVTILLVADILTNPLVGGHSTAL